ncbi:hypothetical protein BCR35DRAFT_221171 [Leucosporidium creatinivorum]|uniref:Uncharacterized protein n=1 Tax=Leucosporidium creatinivorum TaxID=106004 RepID=A0A1Y2D8E8_9BASI|nr:hypothetical protein BCR35DRAFT_221171 [Leucosporidium creatinivorum]
MLPPLPLDVTHRIIRSSLPVVSYSTYKERYRLLLVFSLVHRTWLPLAQAELLKELFLRTSSETWEAHGYRGRDVQGQRYHLGETTKSKKDKPDARLRSLWTLKVKEVTLSNMNFQVEDLAALAGE